MELRRVTIGNLLEETVRRYPRRSAVEYLGQVWSYEQLDNLSNEIALEMLHSGITRGSKVGIWANDRPNTLFCFLALEKIGGIPVMCNTSWTEEELRHQLMETQTQALLFDEGFKETDFVEICRRLELPGLLRKLYIGEKKRAGVHSFESLSGQEKQRSERLTREGQAHRLPTDAEELRLAKSRVQPSDVDVILFTSGSTSSPKGVVTTHFSRVNNARAQAEMIKADCRDVFCVAIPMFHCFSLSGNVLAALSAGACICFPESRKTAHIYSAVERAGCTILTAVPTLFSALLANPHREQYQISTLRTGLVGGAGCSRELFERVCSQLHLDLLPSLGQTEATAGITAGRYEDSLEVRASTVGYLVEHVEGRIVDIRTGKTLPTGESGELCIRGYVVMQGYYGHPELTEQTIDQESFLHTGDMGYFDREGRLYLTGRLKEIIIRGGENIAPGEIEQVIARDPRVAMVKVVGVPDAHYGEEICAWIESKSPDGVEPQGTTNLTADGKKLLQERKTAREESQEPLTVSRVQSLVADHLAAYKVPKYVRFLEKMPLTGNGKIDTKYLKQIDVTEE